MDKFRYKITIEYLGTGFAGWQRQRNALSVQELLEDAIYHFAHERVILHVAGRTDAGVHAIAQVAHFDLEKQFNPSQIIHAINHFTKSMAVCVIDCEQVSSDFQARFSAIKRHYLYRIINRKAQVAIEFGRVWWIRQPIIVDAMRNASAYLIGLHDFTSFRAANCQAKSPIKTLSEINITKNNDEIRFEVSAPSFLYHMVRNIVGSLVYVGVGKWDAEYIKTILETRSREKAGPTAPPEGLYFSRVDYATSSDQASHAVNSASAQQIHPMVEKIELNDLAK